MCKPTCHNVQVPLRVISGLLLLAIFGSIADAAPHNLSCSRVLRLDKPVSGLLLLARSSESASRMGKQLEVGWGVGTLTQAANLTPHSYQD